MLWLDTIELRPKSNLVNMHDFIDAPLLFILLQLDIIVYVSGSPNSSKHGFTDLL